MSATRAAVPAVLRCMQVARCTKIINPGTDEAKYVINVKQLAKASPAVQLMGSILFCWPAVLLLSACFWAAATPCRPPVLCPFCCPWPALVFCEPAVLRCTYVPACSKGNVLHSSHPLITFCLARLLISCRSACSNALLLGKWQPRRQQSSAVLFPPAVVLLQFVVGLGDKVAPTDIEEGMRVG